MTGETVGLYVTEYDPDRIVYTNTQLAQENETLRDHIRYLESLLDAKDRVIAEYQQENGKPPICLNRTAAQARILRDKLVGPDPPTTWAGVVAMSTPEVIHFFTYEAPEAFRFNKKAKNPKRDARIIMKYLAEIDSNFQNDLLGHNKKVLYILFKPD